MKKKIQRLLKHARVMPWQVRRAFSISVCQSIEQAITISEKNHRAEIRFIVEGSLDFHHIFCNVSARERAVNLFSDFRIWDTEHNTGVLVYILFAEQQLEIVADRGISTKVSQHQWDEICNDMTKAFQASQFKAGSFAGLRRITELLHQHFPQGSSYNPDELPNQVIVL